jgi:Family of unknown function (DUF6286)
VNGVRVTLRVLAVLLACALLALGVLVAVEVVLAALGRPAVLPYSSVARTLRRETWESALARAVGIGLCVLGLLLLLPALRRGRPSALPLAPLAQGVDTSVSRRGLQKTLAAAAGRVDGVRSARAEVGRRKVRVTARSRLRETGELPAQVDRAIRDELDRLALRRPLSVSVSTSRRT